MTTTPTGADQHALAPEQADHHRALEAMALYTPLVSLTTVAEVLG